MIVRFTKVSMFLLLFLSLPKTAFGAGWGPTGVPVPPPLFDDICWLCVELAEPDVYLWATGGGAVCVDEEDRQTNNCQTKPGDAQVGQWLIGDCPTDNCEPEEEDLPQLIVEAIDQGNIPGIVEGLRSDPQHAWLNPNRNAIQFAGCGGVVVGHVPVPASMAMKIRAHLQ
jgi:hypothetical protein